jgi:hypothetical protein
MWAAGREKEKEFPAALSKRPSFLFFFFFFYIILSSKGENPAAMQDGSASCSTPLMLMPMMALTSILAVTASLLHSDKLYAVSVLLLSPYIQR